MTRFLFIFSFSFLLLFLFRKKEPFPSLSLKKKKEWAIISLFTACLIYILTYSVLLLLRYEAFRLHSSDLVVHNQVIWKYSRFKSPIATFLQFRPTRHMFQDHINPILCLFAPFYWVKEDLRVLLVVKTLLFSLGVLPLYLLAKEHIKSEFLSLSLSFSYLLHPALGNINLYGFYPVSFSIPFLLFALYFAQKRRWFPFFVLFFLSLSCKENISWVGILLGVWLLLKKEKKIGSIVLLSSSLWLGLTHFFLLPHFGGRVGGYVERFGPPLGKTLTEIVKTVFTHPLFTLKHIFSYPKIVFIFQILMPVGVFLPFLGWEVFFISFPIGGMILLSGYWPMYHITQYYSSPLLPFLFGGAILGIKKFHKILPRFSFFSLGIFLLSLSFLSHFYFGSSPLSRNFYRPSFYHYFTLLPLPRTQSLKELIKKIPSQASVSTQVEPGPRLSFRDFIFLFPEIEWKEKEVKAEYILLDEGEDANLWPLSREEFERELSKILHHPEYTILEKREGYILFKKK